jgi:gamma-glutamyltranspeptidase / glutathione hydrolase
LKAYRPTWSEPLQTSYHGYQVYTLGHPSGGALDTIEAVNLLEVADLKQYGHYTTSPEALYEFIRICRAGHILSDWPSVVLNSYLPDFKLSKESRVTKESARLLWRKMHEPAWEKMLSAMMPENSGKSDNHTAVVVAVDKKGNIAAVIHTINTIVWGTTGIFVDGVSIPDSAWLHQSHIARLKPGDRLPDTINPLIVLKNNKPYLASGDVGIAGHQTTLSNVVNVLDFGMDLKKSIDTPNFMGPFYGVFFDGRPPAPQQPHMELVAEGAFDENLVKAVVAKGQAIKLLPKDRTRGQMGWWVAIQIDPKTGKRIGVAPPGLNGYVAAY